MQPDTFYDQQYFQGSDVQKGYDDYRSLEAGLRQTARVRLRRIGRLLGRATTGRPYRVLEIGCGTGCFLDEARRKGWQVEGLEVSEYATGIARQRKLEVRCAAADQIDPASGPYDCIAMWDVIEHLADPLVVLTRAASRLRPRGVLALSTGDITSLCARISGPRWHLFNLPEHLYFFSPRSLERILAKAGCRVTLLRRETHHVPISYLIERFCKPLGLRRATDSVRGAAKIAVPVTLLDVIGVYAARR